MNESIALTLLVVTAPMMPAISARIAALLTGRRGAPLLQPYRDLGRLLRRGVVYSTASTWVFRAGSSVWLLSAIAAACVVPLVGGTAMVHFPGDFVGFAGCLALGRYALTLSALDTGSSLEGMGVSRELLVMALAEPVLFLACLAPALATGGLSFSEFLGAGVGTAWTHAAPAVVLAWLSLALLLLTETGRGPLDDPAPRLEPAMIRESMTLDHSGPDLALLRLGSAIRFAAFGTLLVNLAVPRARWPAPVALVALAIGLAGVSALVGLVDASFARIPTLRLPRFLQAAGVLAALGTVLALR